MNSNSIEITQDFIDHLSFLIASQQMYTGQFLQDQQDITHFYECFGEIINEIDDDVGFDKFFDDFYNQYFEFVDSN